MGSISYDVDPDGDIELILRKPSEQKIVPTDWEFFGEKDPRRPEFANPPCLGRYKVFSELCPGYGSDNPEAEVRMRASSRHLTLGSRVFRAMLQGPWIEAALSSQPIRQISTERWDAHALAIVLDCIHGRHFEIPTKISPGLLTRISTIVDYYQCREAVQVHYRTWTDESICRLPNENEGVELNILWLFVSRVFHDENRFRKMADMFVRFTPGISNYETHELPVNGFLEKLDDIRETLCNKIFEALDALQKGLMGGGGCDEEDYCNAVLLPILIAERDCMQDNCASTVEPPFDKCQLQEVLDFIENMTTPEWADFEREYPNPKKKRKFRPCFCTIQGRLKPTLDEIDREARSIRLADFQPK